MTVYYSYDTTNYDLSRRSRMYCEALRRALFPSESLNRNRSASMSMAVRIRLRSYALVGYTDLSWWRASKEHVLDIRAAGEEKSTHSISIDGRVNRGPEVKHAVHSYLKLSAFLDFNRLYG